jgi:nicotinamide mononucleotide adenylyltransferase
MKLRELFENIYETGAEPQQHDGALKTVGVCFGRFNPPHKGHKGVWMEAAKNPIWYVGTNQETQGPKDPLPYDVKLQLMAAVWPKVAGHVIPEQSLLTLASRIYEEHGANVLLKVYTDEEWLYKTLSQYNGVEGKQHGGYKFSQIDWVRTQRLASATDLRRAARDGDKERFYKDMGIKPTVTVEVEGKQYPAFEIVAHYLNQYPEKVKENTVSEGTTNAAGIKAKGITKKIDPTQKAAMMNAMTIPAMNQSTGSAYLGWRMGVALAGAPDYPTKAEADNWLGGDPLLSTYTEEELEMVKAASLAVGGGKIENWSGKRSQELPDTNKKSAVAKPKRNKYGV